MQRSRLTAAAVVVLLASLIAGCGGGGGSNKPFVYLASGGSADFVNGLETSFFPAFQKQTGTKVVADTFCCGIDKLQAGVKSGNVVWTATNFATVSDFELAKRAGLLEKLDPAVVPLDKLRPGTYDEYGYQVYRAGTVVAWRPKDFPTGAPTKFEDLFDTARFPGKRCLYKSPQFGGTLEGALLADGVPADKLYPLDLNRAFTKLNTIKDDVVWWSSGAQAAQFLLNGTCKIAAMWSGVAQTTARNGDDLGVAWSHSLLFTGMNSIPKGSPNPAAAQKFLAEVINDKDAQAQFYRKVAYTIPTKELNIPPDVVKWAPEGDNVKDAITEDDQYYLQNTTDITKRWNNWLTTGKP